ncbi:MAG: hypothetical protein WCT45_00790 [Candidatus Paceibacterota bacterium]|jgi:hypothetical protein
MALLPNIPTSFVPRPSLTERGDRSGVDFSGVLGTVAYSVLGVVFVLALGVFIYGRVLSATLASREAALAKAEAAIDPATVEGFVRLRNRITSGQALLNNHTMFSGFFASLETILPATVRFTLLHLSIDATGKARVEGTGVARSFNALAAASSAFATDGRIKDVIFSKISINRDGSVSFGISAALDPKLISFSANSQTPSL